MNQINAMPLRTILLLVASSALSACASMQGLLPSTMQREAVSLHAEQSLADIKLSDAAWPATDWWRALGDPQLDALIDEALRGNPNLEAADARTRLALAQADATDAAQKPTVGAGFSASGIRIPESVVEPPIGGHYSTLYRATVNFEYGIDLWGGKRAAWEAAVDRVHASEVDAQAARVLLSGNVARGYADLANAFAMSDVAQRELDRATDVRKLTDQRVRAGIDSLLQFKQADARVPAARQQMAAAQFDVVRARSALAGLLGAGPDRGLAINRPKTFNKVALELPSHLPAELLGRRADIVAARWRVEAASRDIDVANAAFYPNFDLTAAVGLASLGLSNFLTAQSRYYQVAPAVSLPIFDGGRLRSGLSARDAQRDLAVANYNQRLVSALRSVADAITAMRSFDEQVAASDEVAATTRAAYDLAMRRYNGGVGNYLEALSV
ncbi:MAG: efflux transporter outer membrane subunit, partial [Dokdonella sp.]